MIATEPQVARFATVLDYYAAVRNSKLKPTTVSTVYQDEDGMMWYVDDPVGKTPAQRQEAFAALLFRRGLGPRPY